MRRPLATRTCRGGLRVRRARRGGLLFGPAALEPSLPISPPLSPSLQVLLFGLPALEPLGKISTPGVPSDLQLHAPTEASRHTLSVAFDGGGVQVWEV